MWTEYISGLVDSGEISGPVDKYKTLSQKKQAAKEYMLKYGRHPEFVCPCCLEAWEGGSN